MKKRQICAAIAAGTMLCAALPATAADVVMSPITKLGDANDDGTVSAVDVVNLTRYLLAADTSVSMNADLTADGRLNAFDLALLKAMVTERYQPEDFTGLMINEVCASNQNCHSDADGREPDWIELYNASDNPVHLGGYGISDGKKNLFKYTFPEGTVIAAGSYLLVYCDDGLTSTDPTEHHVAFKLSASGETVYLTHPAYGTLDVVEVPAAQTDITYGRFANGSDSFANLTPTPNATNDTAEKVVLVTAPAFSMESGFYAEAFDLSITADTTDTIYYTTDGSDPRTSATAQEYSSTISIYNNNSSPLVWSAMTDINLNGYTPPDSSFVDKGMVIRAAAKDADGNYSDVVTKNYYINKTAAYYQDMKVVSLTTEGSNLFDSATGIYVIGDGYYAWKNSADYDPTYEVWDTRNPTNYNNSGREWERPATVQVFENGTLAFEGDVGVRISGNASRNNSQKSLRLYARSEYGKSKMEYEFIEGMTDVNGNSISTFDKITLRTGANDIYNTHFRDELIQEIGNGLGLGGQGAEECIVFINGEFWGMYTIKEHLDNEHLAAHYAVDKDNVTYVKNGEADGDQTIVDEYIAFYEWLMTADLSDDANYQRVCDTIDIENFMHYITLETYVCNYDWCNPTWYNNWYMWRTNTEYPSNPYSDGKWRFLMYDVEYSCGLYGETGTSYNYDALGNMNRTEEWANVGMLFYKLLENETFKETFYEQYMEAIDTTFAYENVEPIIDAYVSKRSEAAKATNLRFQGGYGYQLNNWYSGYVDEIKTFFRNRPSYARNYLINLLGKQSDPTSGNMLTDASVWWLYKGDAEGTMTVDSCSDVTLATAQTGSEVWNMQAIYDGLQLEAGKTYQFSYTLQSDGACTAAPHIQMAEDPYTTYFWTEHTVTTVQRTYTQTFTMPETCTNAKAAFDAGYTTGTIYVTDVSLVCLD